MKKFALLWKHFLKTNTSLLLNFSQQREGEVHIFCFPQCLKKVREEVKTRCFARASLCTTHPITATKIGLVITRSAELRNMPLHLRQELTDRWSQNEPLK